jgi:hypothetical protein
MKKNEITEQLYAILENKSLTKEQKLVIREAIVIIKTAKTSDQYFKAVEMLIKLFGIGSKFFDS